MKKKIVVFSIMLVMLMCGVVHAGLTEQTKTVYCASPGCNKQYTVVEYTCDKCNKVVKKVSSGSSCGHQAARTITYSHKSNCPTLKAQELVKSAVNTAQNITQQVANEVQNQVNGNNGSTGSTTPLASVGTLPRNIECSIPRRFDMKLNADILTDPATGFKSLDRSTGKYENSFTVSYDGPVSPVSVDCDLLYIHDYTQSGGLNDGGARTFGRSVSHFVFSPLRRGTALVTVTVSGRGNYKTDSISFYITVDNVDNILEWASKEQFAQIGYASPSSLTIGVGQSATISFTGADNVGIQRSELKCTTGIVSCMSGVSSVTVTGVNPGSESCRFNLLGVDGFFYGGNVDITVTGDGSSSYSPSSSYGRYSGATGSAGSSIPVWMNAGSAGSTGSVGSAGSALTNNAWYGTGGPGATSGTVSSNPSNNSGLIVSNYTGATGVTGASDGNNQYATAGVVYESTTLSTNGTTNVKPQGVLVVTVSPEPSRVEYCIDNGNYSLINDGKVTLPSSLKSGKHDFSVKASFPVQSVFANGGSMTSVIEWTYKLNVISISSDASVSVTADGLTLNPGVASTIRAGSAMNIEVTPSPKTLKYCFDDDDYKSTSDGIVRSPETLATGEHNLEIIATFADDSSKTWNYKINCAQVTPTPTPTPIVITGTAAENALVNIASLTVKDGERTLEENVPFVTRPGRNLSVFIVPTTYTLQYKIDDNGYSYINNSEIMIPSNISAGNHVISVLATWADGSSRIWTYSINIPTGDAMADDALVYVYNGTSRLDENGSNDVEKGTELKIDVIPNNDLVKLVYKIDEAEFETVRDNQILVPSNIVPGTHIITLRAVFADDSTKEITYTTLVPNYDWWIADALGEIIVIIDDEYAMKDDSNNVDEDSEIYVAVRPSDSIQKIEYKFDKGDYNTIENEDFIKLPRFLNGGVVLTIRVTYTDGSILRQKYSLNIVSNLVSDWAANEVINADKDGLIPSTINGDLTRKITREEFCQIALRLYEKLTGSQVSPLKYNPFDDTDSDDILKAYKIGITVGTSDTRFSPRQLITREQMATMMTRTLRIAGENVRINMNTVSRFSDNNEIEEYARESVYFMSNRGAIKGIGNNRFGSKGNATIEQAIVIAERIFDTYGKQ